MVHTVGIVGINGNVGVPTVKALLKYVEGGKIKLVVFHRASSKLDGLKEGPNVEFRVLDFDGPPQELEKAVKGVNVFIKETNLVDALAKSPDLVTYIPPTYSTTWNAADYEDEFIGPIMKFAHSGSDRAKALGIGITPIYTGVFDNYWFEIGFLGAPIKENTVWANETQLRNRMPITSLEHLGNAIARVVTKDPETIKGQEYSVVTFWPTGHELVEVYSKVNGRPAQVKDLTTEDRETKRADVANFGAVPAAYWDKWEKGDWEYESGGKISDNDYSGPSMEEVARAFAQK